jgi:hypothetical protein
MVMLVVYDFSSGSATDVSNGTFVIWLDKKPGQDFNVTFARPEQGEILYSGNIYTVTFNINGGSAPYTWRLNYSTDGANYTAIPGAQRKDRNAGLNAYNWLVPGTPSQNCTLRAEVAQGSNHSWAVSSRFTIAVSPNAPPRPVNVQAVAGDRTVALSWDSAIGAESYRVYRSNTTGRGYVLVGATMKVNFTDTGLANNYTYYYTVTSVNASFESQMSDEVSATPAPGQSPGDGRGEGYPAYVYASVGFAALAIAMMTILAMLSMKRGVAPYLGNRGGRPAAYQRSARPRAGARPPPGGRRY